MGKKKIATQSAEKAIKEQAAIDTAVAKTSPGRKAKRVELVRVYIRASYNNTLITVTDEKGGVLAWSSAGSIGFAGPKKATPFAASKMVSVIAEKLKNYGVVEMEVYMSGIGGGRDSAVRSLINHGFNIISIKDVTPVPHNGPRPPKVRRV
ncbi:MAG: 30S ribosomal protein S11 [Patescibacteria group bacterium]